MTSNKKIVLGAQYMKGGAGGIARVARLSLAALSDQYTVQAMSVEDRVGQELAGVKIKTFSGRRLPYVAANNLALLGADAALYDFPGTARAHFIPWRPYAIWVHGNELWDSPQIRDDYCRVIERASLILANSHLTADTMTNVFGSLPNMHTCWLATEDEDVPQQSAIKGGPPTLLFVGRNDRYFAKGQDILIRLWPQVVDMVPDAKLCFVGGGWALDRLKSLAAESSVSDKIDILGFVPEDQMPPIWQRATAFVLLGRLEGFGLVNIEAMRWAKPVITSIQDAGCEINEDGITGYNVDRYDDEAVLSAIVKLLNNPTLCDTLGAAGHQRWLNHFRPSLFADRFRKAFATMI